MAKIEDFKHSPLDIVWHMRDRDGMGPLKEYMIPVSESDRRIFEEALDRPVSMEEIRVILHAILQGRAVLRLKDPVDPRARSM